jgi:hypothetical protein
VTGSGSISYQWVKNGVAITNANAKTLNISESSMEDAGAYSVVAANNLGSIASQSVTLTVVQISE